MRPLTFLCLLSLYFGSVTTSFSSELPPPQLILANVYQKDIDISQYWISEKLDGVRAYWDGKALISRQGNTIPAPAWFLAQLPKSIRLDGELWIERGGFEKVSAIVRTTHPNDEAWRKVSYCIFDMPEVKQTFEHRIKDMQRLFANKHSKNVKLVTQFKLTSHQELMNTLQQYVDQGAEGLMLHHGSAHYNPGRSDELLKLKLYEDAEAKVIKHFPGKGRFQGMLGSILVEDKTGLQFRIGSGFTDKERSTPPAIGSIISFKFYGKTSNGIPRFASFLRVRSETK
ncbi:MAG: DNA ligase [Gammaproteobacteria bacterium]|nr:DNA ligase [Gammaproteobacteria bacterium]